MNLREFDPVTFSPNAEDARIVENTRCYLKVMFQDGNPAACSRSADKVKRYKYILKKCGLMNHPCPMPFDVPEEDKKVLSNAAKNF